MEKERREVMDPNVTLEYILASIEDREMDIAWDYYTDLQCWLDRGGFPPNWIGVLKAFLLARK